MRIDPMRLMRLATLIDRGSFREAANEMGLTQPALSHSIALLENEVGVRLIERTARGIKPTVYGEALYKHAKGIGWELDQASQCVAELSHGSIGTVTIGVSGGASMIFASQAICRLQARRPAAKLRIVEALTNDALLDQLRDRTLDLVISGRPLDFEVTDANAVRLFPARLVACVRAGHPLGPNPTLKDLENYPFVCASETTSSYHINRVLTEEGFNIPPDKIIISNSISVAKEVVSYSDTFTILSDLAVQKECETGQFITTQLPNQDSFWSYLLSRHEYVPTDLTMSFIDEILAICQQRNIPISPDATRFRDRAARQSSALKSDWSASRNRA